MNLMRSSEPVFRYLAMMIFICGLSAGCGGAEAQRNKQFFTSGNREADQRADQRMTKTEQIRGKTPTTAEAKASETATLFDRVGGMPGLNAIVDDFINRAMADPRVNFKRAGMTRGGFSFHRSDSIAWNPSPADVAQFKKHVMQFLALSSGGPSYYDGHEMKAAHQGKGISNEEFDGAVGDLKATLDKLQVPVKEQKELLSIIESTRTQVVEQR